MLTFKNHHKRYLYTTLMNPTGIILLIIILFAAIILSVSKSPLPLRDTIVADRPRPDTMFFDISSLPEVFLLIMALAISYGARKLYNSRKQFRSE